MAMTKTEFKQAQRNLRISMVIADIFKAEFGNVKVADATDAQVERFIEIRKQVNAEYPA